MGGPLDTGEPVALDSTRADRIEIATFMQTEVVRRLHADPDALQRMDRRDFERLVAEIFDGLGYQVELTKRTRDGGKDVVAVKRREVDLRLLIECKRPDPGNPIRVGVVRELLGVVDDERATKGILATTSYFSPDARELFERNPWKLEPRDLQGVNEWLALYVRSKEGN